MAQGSYLKIILRWVEVILFVIIGSWAAMGLWGVPPEKSPASIGSLVIEDRMTLTDFARANRLPDQIVQRAFNLKSADGLGQTAIQAMALSPAEITDRVNKALAFAAEEGSKNWVKIAAKFACWTAVLLAIFFLLKNNKVTPVLRKRLLLGSIGIFGVILGSDPSPTGTVKDTIVLLGKSGIVFPPRMVALAAMLIFGTLLANKLLCAWGCQFGTLQEFIFRLARDAKDRKGLLPQIKIPFILSNGIRIAVFILMTVAAFVWSIDLVEPIDPFKIYKPAAIGIGGGIFLGIILIAALFVYRPWCQFFCPFGLIGWLIEKVCLFKIIVNHQTCIGCCSCEKACPSTVMGAILKRDRIIPDCFACGTCIEVCPTGSIQLAKGKQGRPPEGKFQPRSTRN